MLNPEFWVENKLKNVIMNREEIAEFNQLQKPEENLNMLVFNYVAYTRFGNRLNQSLTSRFKQYELDREDVPFIHK